MNAIRRVAAAAILASLLFQAAPPASAQVVTISPAEITQMAKDFQQGYQQLQQLQQQVSTAQSQLQIAMQSKNGLSAAQWASIRSAIPALQSVPTALNGFAQQNASTLQKFQTFFPTYKPNADYVSFSTTLAANTANANAAVLSEAERQNAGFAAEGGNLDYLVQQAQNNPGNQALALNVLVTLARQDIEQMRKMRALQIAQTNSMSVYYGNQQRLQQAAVSQQEAKRLENCEATVKYVYANAVRINSKITVEQVRQQLIQQGGASNPCAPLSAPSQ